jgi:hypothetical protein
MRINLLQHLQILALYSVEGISLGLFLRFRVLRPAPAQKKRAGVNFEISLAIITFRSFQRQHYASLD